MASSTSTQTLSELFSVDALINLCFPNGGGRGEGSSSANLPSPPSFSPEDAISLEWSSEEEDSPSLFYGAKSKEERPRFSVLPSFSLVSPSTSTSRATTGRPFDYCTMLKQHLEEKRAHRRSKRKRGKKDKSLRHYKKSKYASFFKDSVLLEELEAQAEKSQQLQQLKKRFQRKRKNIQVDATKFLFYSDKSANDYIDREDDYVEFFDSSTKNGRARQRKVGYYENCSNVKFTERIHHRATKRHKRKKGRQQRSKEELEAIQKDRENFHRLWAGIVKRDIPKAYKQYQSTHAMIISSCKKTALLCQKERRKTVLQIMKTGREASQRAKKMAREVILYWRKYDKIEKEAQKKRAIEERKKRKEEEEMREAQRQKRKLNFLLTQTELYSYFVGKKTGAIEAIGDEASAENISDVATPAADSLQNIQDVEDEQVVQEHAKQAAQLLLQRQREKTRAFDEDMQRRRAESELANGSTASRSDRRPTPSKELQLSTPASTETLLPTPSIFRGKLKMYQRKGLSWVVNLYEQGINGILADEMGLGKTVQSITFLAYLAECKNIWGPFLVISPTSTLHNWQQELAKFCPSLKVLPYWGSQNDRKVIRKYWNPRHLYSRDSPFQVLITNYNIVVRDEKYFHRIKWEYMILDEAQAIKSANSARWKTLLGFSCRNRLLLTGTPIQNSMAELWALLHFIMPTLFDSHEEFTEWFSKDIENHAENKSSLDEHQLSRLHLILKPFMLRRLKKDVEAEMPPKTEVEISCSMSRRQHQLYNGIRAKISVAELLNNTLSNVKGNSDLMNLVMQFRKVCNHPEIFERAEFRSPFNQQDTSKGSIGNSCLTVNLPKLIYRDMLSEGHFASRYRFPSAELQFGSSFWNQRFNIFSPHHIHYSLFKSTSSSTHESLFSWTRFTDLSPAELFWLVSVGPLERWLIQRSHYRSRHAQLSLLHHHKDSFDHETELRELSTRSLTLASESARSPKRDSISSRIARLHNFRKNCDVNFLITSVQASLAPANVEASSVLSSLLSCSSACGVNCNTAVGRLASDASSSSGPTEADKMDGLVNVLKHVYRFVPPAAAPPANLSCSDQRCFRQQHLMMHHPWAHAALTGNGRLWSTTYAPKIPASFSRVNESYPSTSLMPLALPMGGLMENLWARFGSSNIWVPDAERLVADSGKLQVLDQLLAKLKAEGHRVLCYSQMTKMIDILEDYMAYRGYRFVRLDGSSKLSERRDLVEDFQTNPDIFVFLLSTRAGGLGINLTSADTVIFYDSDWNPTNDAQAMDRAHRIGQTEEVTVYRLITKGTIEERILKRAQQKQSIQSLVIAGGKFDRATLKPKEVVSLLLDEEEAERRVKQRQEKKKRPATAGSQHSASLETINSMDIEERHQFATAEDRNGTEEPQQEEEEEDSEHQPPQPQKVREITWQEFMSSAKRRG
ncbi:putative DNA helicase ino80, variant 2 [Balamuthia mandrillaris]